MAGFSQFVGVGRIVTGIAVLWMSLSIIISQIATYLEGSGMNARERFIRSAYWPVLIVFAVLYVLHKFLEESRRGQTKQSDDAPYGEGNGTPGLL